MLKAESELKDTPTHMEPFRAAEKQASAVLHGTQVSTLILAHLKVLSHTCECEPNPDESR